MPGTRCARSLVRKKLEAHEQFTTDHTGSTRHSPHGGLTAYSMLSPETGLYCLRRLRDRSQAWRQRRGDRTTWLCRTCPAHSSHAPARPPHPAPYVRDDRETPLLPGRDDSALLLFLPNRQTRNFLRRGWTLSRGKAAHDLPVELRPNGVTKAVTHTNFGRDGVECSW